MTALALPSIHTGAQSHFQESGLVGIALDHISLPPSSNLNMGISEGCFIVDFASLPLEVARPI